MAAQHSTECYSDTNGSKNHICRSDYKCFIWRNYNGVVVRDCLAKFDVGRDQFYCNFLNSSYCCTTTRCNNDTAAPFMKLLDKYGSTAEPALGLPALDSLAKIVVPAAALCAVIVLLCLLLFILWKVKRKRFVGFPFCWRTDGDSELLTNDEILDHSQSSGARTPMLINRTVSKDVVLIDKIGAGRYGQVYQGRYQDNDVAVKILSTRDELSWIRENMMYTKSLRHPNVLEFIASDISSQDSVTQLWLITHYHREGSLYDYLSSHPRVGIEQALIMLRSAAAGLNYLHQECEGCRVSGVNMNKTAIAHRDIKTKNILVKLDGTCCISDFGLALISEDIKYWIKDCNIRVGTKRYLAPEVLDLTIERMCLEAFKMSDIYSFGLVIWEVLCNCGYILLEENSKLRECEDDNQASNHGLRYRLPYDDMVKNDPSFEEMENVVSKKNRRPAITVKLRTIMVDSWCPKPSARLTILRVQKDLKSLLEKVNVETSQTE